MTVNGGDKVKTVDVNRRVGTTTATSNGSATSGTTELVADTVTASVIAGRRYRIRSYFPCTHSVANDEFFVLIREGTTISGTQLTYDKTYGHSTARVEVAKPEVDWTAPSTGSVSFCVCMRRANGTGTLTPNGATTQPRSLIVELAD